MLVALLLRRLVGDTIKARRGEVPVTRLVVPALILAAAILVANHVVPRPVAAAVLLAIDLVFLGICFGLVRALRRTDKDNIFPEPRLQNGLEQFFPPWFARFVSMDITVLSHAVVGLRAFVDVQRPTPQSYVQGSKLVIAGMIIAVAVIPDAVLFWLLLPHKLWWLSVLLNVLDIWACLWLFGLYGTMVRRPHELSQEKVIFRNGILQSAELDPKNISRIRSLGIVKRYKLPRRKGDGSTVLTFGGVPLIEITLAKPGTENHLFLPNERKVQRIFVATDAPAALCRELLNLSGHVGANIKPGECEATYSAT